MNLIKILRHFSDALREEPTCRVSVYTVNALLSLYENPDQPTGDLAKVIGITGAGTTSLVDELIKKGLVYRFAKPGDRRFVLIGLTTWGIALCRAALHEGREV